MSNFFDQPRIMGIININDDSFSGDGSLELEDALELCRQMISEGAMMIDVGGESARTNREAIAIDEEINRLLPFIEQWDSLVEGQPERPWLSINTWRPEIIEAVLQTGKVDLVNDISGLPDSTNAKLCVEHDAMLLIMHSVGVPKVAHLEQEYDDVWLAIETFFEGKIELAKSVGLKDSQIMIDPGIDFAKQRDHNLTIYRQVERLQRFGYPVLLPVSRKTVIGEVLDLEDPIDRDAGTVACIARGVSGGANVFRVHNVKAAQQALAILKPIV